MADRDLSNVRGLRMGDAMNAISQSTVTKMFPAGDPIPQADGSVLLVADGTTGAVFSCDATGHLGTKPAGTVDNTTKAKVSGNFVVFNPGEPYAFLWLTDIL